MLENSGVDPVEMSLLGVVDRDAIGGSNCVGVARNSDGSLVGEVDGSSLQLKGDALTDDDAILRRRCMVKLLI